MRLRPLAAAALAAGLLTTGGTAAAQSSGGPATGGVAGSAVGSVVDSSGAAGVPTGSLGSLGGPATPTSYALIGDVPYGDKVIGEFPGMIGQINAANPAFTVHVGDIKNGSTVCSDEYFGWVRSQFDTFAAPMVYTPGDNEWTDCHRPNNGRYNPLERLAKVRQDFFPTPGTTLGRTPMRVHPVNPVRTPENVRWGVPGAVLATTHVVGSNDDLQPWTGIGQTEATPEQVAEQKGRMDDAVATVHEAFTVARATGTKAVVIHQQADMFDPTTTPKWTDISAFARYIQALVDESATFDGKVYLFDGDSHKFNEDKPLAAGSPWLGTYGVTGTADNLTRVTVNGSDLGDVDWVKVTVTPGAAEPVSWTRVPFTH